MKRRRIAGKILSGAAVLMLALVTAGYLLIKSSVFENYLLRTAMQILDQVTGGRAEIKSLEISPSTLTVSLQDLTIHGTDVLTQPALLHIDRLTVRPKFRTFLYGKVILDTIVIDHPIVHAVFQAQSTSHIQRPSPTGMSRQTSSFGLRVSHLLVRSAEVYYSDQRTPFDVEIYDLAFDIQIDPHGQRHNSWLSYQDGRLQCPRCTPLRHSLAASFNVTPSHLSIESARVTAGSSTLLICGKVDDFSSLTIDLDYDLQIHTEDFAKPSSVIPLGNISLSGKANYKSLPDRPFLLNFSIDGQLSSSLITASSRVGVLPLRNLHARYQLSNSTLRVREVTAELLGGHATVEADIQDLDSIPRFQVAAHLQEISVQEVQRAMHAPEVQRVAFYGTFDGVAHASWVGSFSNIISHFDMRVHAPSDKTMIGSEEGIPMEASIHMSYDGRRNVITFEPTTIRMPSLALSIHGEAGNRSNLHIDATARDLHQLSPLLSAFRVSNVDLTNISGSVQLKATMQGYVQEPCFDGALTGQNLVIQKSQWKTTTIAGRLCRSEFVIQHSSLINANQGKAALSGSLGLRNWSYFYSNPITLHLSVQGMRLADLQAAAKLHYRASGELWADVDLHGSALNPVGSGAARIVDARIYDEPVQSVLVKFRANDGAITSTADITSHAGSISMNVLYVPSSRAYNLQLNASSIVLQELHTIRVHNLPLTGVLKASASGQGTLDNPRLTAVLDLPQLDFRGIPISILRGEVSLTSERAELALSSRVANASVQLRGRVNLGGNYYSEIVADTGLLQLDRLANVCLSKSPEGLQGQTEIHATLKGPLKNNEQLEAHLNIPALNVSYQSLQISAVGPIRADYAHSVVTLQAVELRGSGTSFRVEGSAPLRGTSAMNFTAQGSIDAGLLRVLEPDLKTSGTLLFDVRTTGSTKTLSIQGNIQLREFSLSRASAPFALDHLSGSLEIANNHVRISSLTGQIGGGDLSITGSVLYWPSLQFDMTMETKAVRLRHPSGFRVLLDSNLALTGKSSVATLKGHILIDNLSFSPDFDLRRLSEMFGSTVPQQTGFADSLKLAIAVQSKNRLSATSSAATVEGNVDLQLVGTAANPVIVGRTILTSGEFFYRARRYQLQQGSIVFSDPHKTTPALDVSVTSTVQQYNLTLTLRGPLDRLSTSYASDPPLATADIISLIAIGNTSQTADAAGHGTDSILASQVGSQFSTKIQNLTGISGLRIDPLIGGSYRNPSARIAIQQRVTKNFLFTFSTDVSQPGEETVEGKYQINQRWSVGAARDPVGGVSVNGTYYTRF